MARVIVCNGRHGKKPLCFPGNNQKLYTNEEICYTIYHNLALAEDYLTDSRLADYYEKELALPETAKTLRMLCETGAAVKDFVSVLFASTLMYTKEEQAEFLQELTKWQEQKPWQKKKAKADFYQESGEYRMALSIYEKLLQEKELHELSEIAVGNIIHNLAICELHILGPKSAAVHFAEAYERNHSTESLRSYLLCLRLAKRETEFIDAVTHYRVSESLRSEIDMLLVDCAVSAGETPEYQSLLRIKRLLFEGELASYRHATKNLIMEFMKQYRRDAL